MNAWEVLGTRVDCARASTALRKGGLEWEVNRLQVRTDPGGLPVPGQYAIVRDDMVLGVVGEVYRVTQNHEHEPLLTELATLTGARFAYAGMIENGRRVFVTLRLPGGVLVGLVASHDGSLARSLVVTPLHEETGTLLNFGHVTPIRKRSTTQDLVYRIAVQSDWFQQTSTRMADKPMTQNQFERLLLRHFGAPEGAAKATVTRTGRQLERIADMYQGSTAWDALVTVCDWADHEAPARGADPEASRAHRAILSPTTKAKALEVMR